MLFGPLITACSPRRAVCQRRFCDVGAQDNLSNTSRGRFENFFLLFQPNLRVQGQYPKSLFVPKQSVQSQPFPQGGQHKRTSLAGEYQEGHTKDEHSRCCHEFWRRVKAPVRCSSCKHVVVYDMTDSDVGHFFMNGAASSMLVFCLLLSSLCGICCPGIICTLRTYFFSTLGNAVSLPQSCAHASVRLTKKAPIRQLSKYDSSACAERQTQHYSLSVANTKSG